MADFAGEGERAATGWRLAAAAVAGAPSPLRAEVAGRALLVFHARAVEPGGNDDGVAVVSACVVDTRCAACDADRGATGAWSAHRPNEVRCPACGEVERVDGDAPEWPVMCVDDEVYVYLEDR